MAISPKSPEARERLAAALRENLKRRKAKTRGTTACAPPAEAVPGPEAPDAASRSGEKQGD